MPAAPMRRIRWSMPAGGAIGAVILLLPKLVLGNDFGAFLLTALLGAVVCIILLGAAIVNIRRLALSVLLMLAIFVVGCMLLFRASDEVRSTGRWLLESKSYKARVLAQPPAPSGELRHVEWDGWGFAGAGDTVVYLVFDPNDSLAVAANSHAAGKFDGIPCEVPQVRRLQARWYTVLFYTETDWEHCS